MAINTQKVVVGGSGQVWYWPGPKTAVIAGLQVWLVMLPVATYVGAMLYKEE